jgi:hypothetical protein
MGRGEAQARREPGGSNCPHCVSGDIVPTLSSAKGVHVNELCNQPPAYCPKH